MPADPKTGHLAALQGFVPGFLKQTPSHLTKFKAGQMIVADGEGMSHVYLILSGWVVRSRFLADGRRQIFDFHLPCDLAGLDACRFERSIRDWQCLTPVVAQAFEPRDFVAAASSAPEAVSDLIGYYAQQMAHTGERLIGAGRRTAREKITHILLELWHRLQRVGLADTRGYEFPVTQDVFADAVGLTPIHVNRTLKQLREEGIIEIRYHSPPRVELLDPKGAAEIAAFDIECLRLFKL